MDDDKINLKIEFCGRQCLHYGYYDENDGEVVVNPEYWRAKGFEWDIDSVDYKVLYVTQCDLLRDDMIKCGNMRNVPDYYKYHNDKKKMKKEKNNIKSKWVLEDL